MKMIGRKLYLISLAYVSLCQLHRSVRHDRCKLSWTGERFPICNDKITENDRCVIKIIGIHCYHVMSVSENCKRQLQVVKILSLQKLKI